MSSSSILRRFINRNSILIVKPKLQNICRLCSTAIPEEKQDVSSIKTNPQPNVSPADPATQFKKVMRTVPQPVVVVTTAEWDEMQQMYHKRGITCSSFTSVSLEPPVVSVCIGRVGKPCDMHDLLLRTQHFAVHVLSKDQVSHSVRFATPITNILEDHFAGFPHHRGDQNLPILEGTSAVVTCKAMSVHPIGDHFVWSYRAVGDEMFMQAFEDTTFPFDQWTHEAHIRMAWNYLKEYGREEATPLIKSGIKRYNQTNEHLVAHGFSETVTEFYIHMISNALEVNGDRERNFQDFLAKNPHLLDRQLIFKYYSDKLVQQPESRETFMPPDKKPLP